MSKIRLAGVIRESIVDGPGIRLTVFTQGCPHKCEGCQNPQTHSFDGGYISETNNIVKAIKQNPMLQGVTFSGGEPFMQCEPLIELAKECHSLGLNVMVYTGFTFEELQSGFTNKPQWRELLENIDILVDGKFILAEKSLMLHFRGSKNQRIINVPKSLKQGCVVLRDDLM